MKVASRLYYCPVCLHQQKHDTNHQDEIYCPCRVCSNSPLYCAEVDSNANRPYRTAVIRFYDCDMSTPEGNAEYKAIEGKLIASGYKMFNVYIKHEAFAALNRHNGESVKLFDPDQFEDQYVSTIGRLHEWFQAAWDNWQIKTGYYLEMTDHWSPNTLYHDGMRSHNRGEPISNGPIAHPKAIMAYRRGWERAADANKPVEKT